MASSSPPPRVFVTERIPLEHLSPLDDVARIVMPDDGVVPSAQVLKKIGDCTAVLTQGELRVDAELLDAAPALRFVANAAMGIDNLDLAELHRRGIAASNTPAAFVESTADHTLGLLLNVTRRISEADRFVRTGQWAARGVERMRWEGTLLGGKTLGMIGYGRIAKQVETRARAFDMEVIHTKSTPHDHPGYRALDTLLGEADVVVVLVPLTPETHHLVNAERLARMKRGAFFINVARGKVMDEAAVVDALRSGHLAGAAFDVFEEEPVVSEALLAMDQVVLAPHIGGATREQRRRARLEASDETARFLRGETRRFAVELAL
ncbi:MAG: D-glycerate dehydrogenase [Verrucomicrobiaceae bacterium]|nr:D-glycerate dehydrogenase [Verrucomicrobiaceae bacterium]